MSGAAWVRVGAVVGFLAVAIGAFGAHGLKERLELNATSATFQTGVNYHMFHATALLAVGFWLMNRSTGSSTAASVAGWAFLVGIVLFSGSLYVLSITGIKALGMITPFGGLAFLVGWIALAIAASGPAPRAEPVVAVAAPEIDFANEKTLNMDFRR